MVLFNLFLDSSSRGNTFEYATFTNRPSLANPEMPNSTRIGEIKGIYSKYIYIEAFVTKATSSTQRPSVFTSKTSVDPVVNAQAPKILKSSVSIKFRS